MFKKFINDVSKLETPEMVTVQLSASPSINATVFRERLNSLSAMGDKELYDIIKESYKSILKDIFKREDASYLDVFTTPKFISTLTQVLNSVELTYDERITCNKLSYDYFTLKNHDPYIKELLFILAKMVNRDKIPGLFSIGLPENLATYMAIARFSDDKDSVNIKRLNFIITTSAVSIMNPQMIVFIYEKLFDRVGSLINTTMFDVLNDEEEWVTEDIMEVYSNISYAILVILNNLPSQSIRKVLVGYTNDFEMIYGADQKAVRFSMRAISPEDFSRIIAIVEQLRDEGIIVP